MASNDNPIVQLGYLEETLHDVDTRVPVEMERHWERKYATENRRIAKARKMRAEIVRDTIAQQEHHKKLATCIEKIESVDVASPTASLEIYKWGKAAELHQKMMSKYVPDVKAVEISVDEDTRAAAEGVSRAMEILERIAGSRRHQNDARAGQDRPVVSSAVPPETGGFGESTQT